MFENIKKEDRTRYFTIAMIALFVFSTVALYMSTPAGGTPPGKPGQGAGSNATYTFTGRGMANATLMNWDPAIFVRGSDARLPDELALLRESGVAVKDVPQAGGHILTLADASLVYNVSQKLLALNVSVRGMGMISFPSAYVEGDGVSRLVGGGTYYYENAPEFEQGDVFPIVFDAYVQGDRLLYAPQNIVALPSGIVDLEITPVSVEVNNTYLQAALPWEARNVDIGQFQINLPGGDKVKFRQKSVVYFRELLSGVQMAQLNGQRPVWAASDAQEGLIGVNPAFNNRSAIEADLARIGVQPPVYPDSYLEVYPYREIRNQTQIEEDTARIWNETFPDVSVQFKPAYRLSITLPASVEANGQTYSVRQREFDINSNFAPQENGTLKASYQPRGRQLDRPVVASYSPHGYVEALPGAG